MNVVQCECGNDLSRDITVELKDYFDKVFDGDFPLESGHKLNPPLGYFSLAITDDGSVAGCAGFSKVTEDTVKLVRMYVRPEHRGKGVAKSILFHLENKAYEDGATTMILETHKLLSAAVNFYHSVGYGPSEPHGLYTEDPDSIYMKRSLPRDL